LQLARRVGEGEGMEDTETQGKIDLILNSTKKKSEPGGPFNDLKEKSSGRKGKSRGVYTAEKSAGKSVGGVWKKKTLARKKSRLGSRST